MAITAKLTAIGLAKYNAFITGGPTIEISQAAIGDGGGSVVVLPNPPTGLVNQVWIGAINRTYLSSGVRMVEFIIPTSVGGFWMRELSLKDSAGDTIAVAVIPESNKPDPATGASKLSVFTVAIEVANGDAVTELIMDTSEVMATRAYVEDQMDDISGALPAVWPDSEKLQGQTLAQVMALIMPTGSELAYWGTTAPAGFVLASGRTIGSAASGATERANADTEALYTLLWNSMTQTDLPIQTSAGGASTRGASAAADFAANKRLPLPDMRGRVGVGKDNMGGTAANRMTAAGAGIDGTVLGKSGGTETHTLTSGQIPAHTHTASTNSAGAHTHTSNLSPTGNQFTGSTTAVAPDGTTNVAGITTTSAGAHSHTVTVDANTGGGGAHPNVQPSIVRNVLIKL